MWRGCVLGILLLINNISGDEDPVVKTPRGSLRGLWRTSRSGRQFQAFLSVPYAKPPVGELRFQPSEPLPAWTGTKDAKAIRPFCLQYSPFFSPEDPILGVDDCLYLSVFTNNISSKAPVLVHIHGGGFVCGSGNFYDPENLIDDDIVIVDVNYRVGIYGFLSFETPEWPGNQGMKDQVLALRWVQENIASFGGDPNQVTIIGESAGGASVYHHIVSPLSRGLFHRAIAQSGTSYSPWALAPPGLGRANAEKLMRLIGCPTDPQEALPCIRKKEPADVLRKLENFMEWYLFPVLTFGPVLEAPGPKSFLVKPVSQWDHNPVPLMLGVTSGEGLLGTQQVLKEKEPLKWVIENFDRLAPYTISYFASASNSTEITKSIHKFYNLNDETTANVLNSLTLAHGDGLFTISIMDGANKHKGEVYFYYFDYISNVTIPADLPQEYAIGANHASETAFIWNITLPGFPVLSEPEDIKLSKKLVEIVKSFIKNGKPIIEGADWNWKTWTSENHNYVHINNDGFHLRKGLAEERYKFWKSIKYDDNMENLDHHINNYRNTEL